MYTSTNHDKLQQIMEESPEHKEIIRSLIDSQKASLHTITHEIRNPLTLVYSTLQLIESSHPEVLSFNHWDALHNDVVYMVQLLEELSDYNHSGSLHIDTLDTTPFLRQAVLSFAASTIDSPVEFSSSVPAGLPSIEADATKLKEVLLNLLKNAYEAFEPGASGSIRLNAETWDSNHYLRIRIQDTGCGIPAEHLEDIFTPFVTFKAGGTGLGLPLSRRIIEAHGGKLEVSSAIGIGTVFTILLPI